MKTSGGIVPVAGYEDPEKYCFYKVGQPSLADGNGDDAQQALRSVNTSYLTNDQQTTLSYELVPRNDAKLDGDDSNAVSI
ncbi:hypothetical protein EVAR_66988_1 [Eumeta japonica]|uniref:Uncharacterized protein n=1 Tax=Eumeta variegata TaxID=151549 RepID=A0A4C1ZR48_EUMVA|nr:hypothetical protein EVAR_66988_1 [Eumeta japonica]